MFRFGAAVRVSAADHAWFGRRGRIVSTRDPDVVVVEWCDKYQYSSIPQRSLASAQAFSKPKWRLISALRRSEK